MYIVLLKFSANKSRASRLREGHTAWIKRGFDDGVVLLAGSFEPGLRGGILVHNTSLADLQARGHDDPFVAENVVKAEIFELDPGKADERLQILVN